MPAAFLIAAAVQDLRSGRIANTLTGSTFVLGCIHRFCIYHFNNYRSFFSAGASAREAQPVSSVLVHAVILLFFFIFIFGYWFRLLGGGDLKLLIACRIWLDAEGFLFCAEAAFLIAGILVIIKPAVLFLISGQFRLRCTGIRLALPICISVLCYLRGFLFT